MSEREIAAELELLKDTLPTVTVGGVRFFVAQGDLRLDEVTLRQFAAERVAARGAPEAPEPFGLVGNRTPDGRMRRWRRGSTLSYAVHRDTFDTELDYVRVVDALSGAATEWAAVTGLRFVHRVELDAERAMPPTVTFVVQQRELFSYIALAFFPGDPPETRVIAIDPSWFSTRYDQTGVLRHELGHVLGFRHEHIRGEVPAACRTAEPVGDVTMLTDYDPRSTMHYPCGALGTTTFHLTDLDREGARKVYLDEDTDPTAFEDIDPEAPQGTLPPPSPPEAGLSRWQYTRELLLGVPMLDTRGTGIPRDQRPRLGWFVRVAEVAIGLGLNRVASAAGRLVAGGLARTEPLDLGHLGAGSVGASERSEIDRFLDQHGDRTLDELHLVPDPGAGLAPPGLGVLRTAVATARQGLTDPLAILRQVLRNAPGAASHAPTLEDYNALFATVDVPSAFGDWPLSDEMFAEMRVAGFTPMVLTRAEELPFALPDDSLAAVTGAGDTTAQALVERRLYVCDYADVAFPPLASSTIPHGPKYGFGPTLILALPPGTGVRRLRPVAIRLDRRSPRFVGPSDATWGWHKLAVQSADANRHELVDHLACTHLLIEPMVVATQRCLPDGHPVARLLWPHFEGTLSINDAAVTGLLGEGKPVDQELAGTIDSAKAVAGAARLGRAFALCAPPAELEARGVMDPDLHYPYRDDALLLWQAISDWTGAYVRATIADDTAVASDRALERWRAEIADPTLGAVRGFGEQAAAFATRAGLARALATIVFVASAQHAALNFPQRGLMCYAPGVPGALYTRNVPIDLIVTLPPLDLARLQLEFLSLLGGVYYTRLGAYRDDAIPAAALPALTAFQAALRDAEETIARRNKARPLPYPYLLPSCIPQSINV